MEYLPAQGTEIRGVEELRKYLDEELWQIAKVMAEQSVLSVVVQVGTKADIAALTTSALAIRTGGYYSVGDGGGALYKRVAAEPTHEGKAQSASGVWYEYVLEGFVNVRQFGAVGNWTTTDDTAAFNNAFHYLEQRGGGMLVVPPALYGILGGLVSIGSTRIVGSGVNSTSLIAAVNGVWADVTVLNQSGPWCSCEHLTIFGKGTPGSDNGSFGATVPAFVTTGHAHDMRIWGGYYNITTNVTDAQYQNLDCAGSYGPSLLYTTGSNWYLRCKFDHSTSGVASDPVSTASNRLNSTVYTPGKVRILSGHYIVCKTGGTSAASPPALKNYGFDIVDGSVVWRLLSPLNMAPIRIEGGAGENHFIQCDGAGEGMTYSYYVDAVGAILNFTDCVAAIYVQHCLSCIMRGATIAQDIQIVNPMGHFTMAECKAFGLSNINIPANMNDFIITDNNLLGGTITVSAGTSDHYNISGNIRTTVLDLGTGVNKYVAGNVA